MFRVPRGTGVGSNPMKRITSRGIEALLDGLDLDKRALLYHLMACPSCSGEAVMEMAGRDGGKLFLRRGVKETTATSAEELEPHSWAERLAQAEPTQFDLFRRALSVSREIQPVDPWRSEAIADTVVQQRGRLFLVPGGSDVVVEALALTMNTIRLLRKYGVAEGLGLLDGDILKDVSGVAQGMYRRARALMLWEQGELESAIEQFELAEIEFGSSGATGEEGATLALLGLALLEQGQTTNASYMLMAGLSGMVRGERPWLEVRALLALAVACCRGGRPDLGRIYLMHVETLEGSAGSGADLLWGRGKTLAALKDTGRAVPLLREARDRMVERKCFGEAILVTLDLTYALVTGGEAELAPREIEKLGEWFAGEPSVRTVRSLEAWWGDGESPGIDEQWRDMERALLIELRDEDGPGLEPLPFA